jgi:hypothetical protein
LPSHRSAEQGTDEPNDNARQTDSIRNYLMMSYKVSLWMSLKSLEKEMSEELREQILQLLRDELRIDVHSTTDYYDGQVSHSISLKLGDEEISTIWI